jgi:lipid-binding SYLF domain-containing protein
MNRALVFTTAAVIVGGFASAVPALAQSTAPNEIVGEGQSAQQRVNDAAQIVQVIKANSYFGEMLKRAKGVFIIPTLVKGAFVGSGQGAEGVLLKHESNRTWSDPAFLTIHAISVDVQAGGRAGPAAMILMTEKALNSFTQAPHISLNADAGLTIVNYSAQEPAPIGNYAAQGPTPIGEGDIVIWSGPSGFFAEADVNGVQMNQNLVDDRAYYGKPVNAGQILDGEVSNPHADQLKSRLPA